MDWWFPSNRLPGYNLTVCNTHLITPISLVILPISAVLKAKLDVGNNPLVRVRKSLQIDTSLGTTLHGEICLTRKTLHQRTNPGSFITYTNIGLAGLCTYISSHYLVEIVCFSLILLSCVDLLYCAQLMTNHVVMFYANGHWDFLTQQATM